MNNNPTKNKNNQIEIINLKKELMKARIKKSSGGDSKYIIKEYKAKKKEIAKLLTEFNKK